MVKTVRLLKKFVEEAPEGKYIDADVPSLQLRVGKHKRAWYFMKKYKFKQYCISIGPYPAVTREMAADKCNIFLSNLIQFGQIEPQDDATAQPVDMTVKEVYLFYMKEKGFSLNDSRRKAIWKYLEVFADRQIRDISNEEIKEFHKNFEHPIMANDVIKLLRAAINLAIKQGKYTGTNPASNVTLNREKPRHRYLLPSEAPKVIEYLEAMQKKGVKQCNAADALLLMLYSWQRKSNVLSMRWDEIDETGTWTVPAEKAKSGKDISFPLPKEALEILDRRKDNGSEYVFPNPRNPSGHLVDIKKSWKHVLTDCGIQDCRIHDLRHTGATHALRSGADITTVSDGLAHASVSFTAKVYAHVMMESKQEAARGAIDSLKGKRKK